MRPARRSTSSSRPIRRIPRHTPVRRCCWRRPNGGRAAVNPAAAGAGAGRPARCRSGCSRRSAWSAARCWPDGHIVAAQAHLWFHVGTCAPKDDPRALELLVSLNHYSGLPLLLREQSAAAPVARRCQLEGGSREGRRGLADQGKWLEAAGIIDRLGGTHGAEPTLLYNRAVLAGRLADDRALVAGLHAYAQMDVPLDDAVEAEAIAQLLDQRQPKNSRSIRSCAIYAINDLDHLVAKPREPTAAVQHVRTRSGTAAGRQRPAAAAAQRSCSWTSRCPSRASASQRGRRALPRRRDLDLRPADRSAGTARVDHRPRPRIRRRLMATLAEVGGDALGEMTEEQRRRLDHAHRAGAQLALAFSARYAACRPPQACRPRSDTRPSSTAGPTCHGPAWAARRRAKRPAIRSCVFR